MDWRGFTFHRAPINQPVTADIVKRNAFEQYGRVGLVRNVVCVFSPLELQTSVPPELLSFPLGFALELGQEFWIQFDCVLCPYAEGHSPVLTRKRSFLVLVGGLGPY